MSITNPSEFVNQFRAELIEDLGLSPSISCPKCCIMYVGEYDDCCRYERVSDSDSDSEDEEVITQEILNKKYSLVCQFDYYDTDMKVVINEWTEKLLKLCYEIGGDELKNKWMHKLSPFCQK
jgi:hypothetical protein